MTRLQVDVRHRLAPSFALDVELDLRFDARQPVAALFGPSGCGKSTTLALIAGLVAPDAGQVILDGIVLTDSGRDLQVRAEERAIGLVSQDGLLFPHLDVGSNLAYAERRARGRPHPERGEIVEALRLGALLSRGVKALSGGERQRVALARALLAGPRLLLLDEPVSALDESARWEVLGFVERVTQLFGVPALYVSHQRSEVARIAAQIARMEAGRVVDTGPARAVLTQSTEIGTVPNLFRATRTDGSSGAARLDDGSPLTLPAEGAPGSVVWCRVSSGAIVLERPGKAASTSARCHIAGRVLALSREALRVRVAIDAAIPLHVDVTPEAADEFGLAPGVHVVCTFKSHSIEVLG